MKFKKITIRKSGKCHPAIEYEDGGIMAVCTCPGSQNGSLANGSLKISEGHEQVNCRRK